VTTNNAWQMQMDNDAAAMGIDPRYPCTPEWIDLVCRELLLYTHRAPDDILLPRVAARHAVALLQRLKEMKVEP